MGESTLFFVRQNCGFLLVNSIESACDSLRRKYSYDTYILDTTLRAFFNEDASHDSRLFQRPPNE